MRGPYVVTSGPWVLKSREAWTKKNSEMFLFGRLTDARRWAKKLGGRVVTATTAMKNEGKRLNDPKTKNVIFCLTSLAMQITPEAQRKLNELMIWEKYSRRTNFVIGGPTPPEMHAKNDALWAQADREAQKFKPKYDDEQLPEPAKMPS